MYRAASYLEKNELYKSADYIAPKLLPRFVRFLVGCRLVNFNWEFFPKGIYEYVIARTKYMDEIFKGALESGFDQILIFGAGFDSRAIRFAENNFKTKIFELDSSHTQRAKIRQLSKRKIHVPDNTIFIPVDFSTDSVDEKLELSGFRRNKTTLFVMEGLIMYLNKEAVNNLFELIHKIARPKSIVVFDYIYASVLRRENIYYGEKNIYEKVNSVHESWLFGIEKGEIQNFLNKHKLKLREHFDSDDLERRYFSQSYGKIVGKVNGTHCIVLAEK